MYTVIRTQTIEFITELSGDPMHLDVLLAMVSDIREKLDKHGINAEDLDSARFEVKGYPTPSHPEHLVVTLRSETSSRAVHV